MSVNADLETTPDVAACADEERVFTYDEPDEDFCAHLMECYEWKTTGQRGVDWADTVARYRLSHPMEYEARPTLAETTGLLTGAIDAGIKFSVAVQTLFPAGTSIEGDREIRDSFVKGKARRIKPSRYLGGPSALALWAENPVTVRITADAARFARGAELPTSLSLDTVIGVITGHCVCVDLRQADIPSPSEELPVVGAVLHLTTMSKYLVVLYNILMEKGDRFDMVSVPLYYAVGSIEAGQRKRREVLAATPLNDPPEPGAYGWINERAWQETAPVLDKLLALFLTDGLDVREIEGARRTTFVAFEEGELERRDEQERARKAAEERQRAAEEQAAREAEARRVAEQAERERKQAEREAERARQQAEQRERDIKNIDAIKEAAIQAEARCRAMKTRMEAMVQEQKDLTAAYNAQGAQLAKEQNMIGTMVSKTAAAAQPAACRGNGPPRAKSRPPPCRRAPTCSTRWSSRKRRWVRCCWPSARSPTGCTCTRTPRKRRASSQWATCAKHGRPCATWPSCCTRWCSATNRWTSRRVSRSVRRCAWRCRKVP